ncbi:hypothetical protein [Brevibacillus brevis]|uniref:hypothetical protein n=1 Tax=Brevibacillus brevis TaxID=1393 RepID=UPI000D101360|nr:hypothetical protein [Brevibacillus brevis]PSJ63540.1 hypothetical protein C7J99_31270 [Brevibacillus brevis]RED33853.1 hypothetical protein DES34_10218 [Brevibacillus brevis]GEC93344.1 hypothetical protein BBR01nite_56750 [Brevibacillus brevis]VEF92577.1 Uncharacterised protein [Brevibacillus brevis]
MKMTLEIDLNDMESLRKARALLDFHLRQLQPEESVQENENPLRDYAYLKMLKEFAEGLSEKQRKVWDYFLNHPGNALGTELKAAVPDLQPQGALAGVFKATQRWVTMGGQRELSPFVQVDWSKTHGCGIYRGLSQEEIDFLTR